MDQPSTQYIKRNASVAHHLPVVSVCNLRSLSENWQPRSRLRSKLKDHILGTLQILTTKYDGCGIIIGADKNKMDISPLVNTNLKLKQIVSRPSRKKEILDICLTNLFSFYNAPIIVPPVQPDIPGQGVPSDHSVPLCVPNRDPFNPPAS